MISRIGKVIATYGIVDCIMISLSRVFYKLIGEVKLRLCGVDLGRGVIFEGPVHVHGGKRVAIGNGAKLGPGVLLDAGGRGTITIGERTYVGRYSTVIANSRVTIGNSCLIAPFAYIIDSDHGIHDAIPIRLQPYTMSSVALGDDVWLGVGSTVLKGVCIGPGAVVGAGSVVTRSVPSGAIVAGAPAHEIGFRLSAEELSKDVIHS